MSDWHLRRADADLLDEMFGYVTAAHTEAAPWELIAGLLLTASRGCRRFSLMGLPLAKR